MKVDTGIITSNTNIGKDVYRMEIETDLAKDVDVDNLLKSKCLVIS